MQVFVQLMLFRADADVAARLVAVAETEPVRALDAIDALVADERIDWISRPSVLFLPGEPATVEIGRSGPPLHAGFEHRLDGLTFELTTAEDLGGVDVGLSMIEGGGLLTGTVHAPWSPIVAAPADDLVLVVVPARIVAQEDMDAVRRAAEARRQRIVELHGGPRKELRRAIADLLGT